MPLSRYTFSIGTRKWSLILDQSASPNRLGQSGGATGLIMELTIGLVCAAVLIIVLAIVLISVVISCGIE
mgnify:FL=1